MWNRSRELSRRQLTGWPICSRTSFCWLQGGNCVLIWGALCWSNHEPFCNCTYVATLPRAWYMEFSLTSKFFLKIQCSGSSSGSSAEIRASANDDFLSSEQNVTYWQTRNRACVCRRWRHHDIKGGSVFSTFEWLCTGHDSELKSKNLKKTFSTWDYFQVIHTHFAFWRILGGPSKAFGYSSVRSRKM